jgi:hypothetical protein
MKSFPHMVSMDEHVKTVNILPMAEHAQKFVWRRLSVYSIIFKILKNRLGTHLIGRK